VTGLVVALFPFVAIGCGCSRPRRAAMPSWVRLRGLRRRA
jgi:hypothetical protein